MEIHHQTYSKEELQISCVFARFGKKAYTTRSRDTNYMKHIAFCCCRFQHIANDNRSYLLKKHESEEKKWVEIQNLVIRCMTICYLFQINDRSVMINCMIMVGTRHECAFSIATCGVSHKLLSVIILSR